MTARTTILNLIPIVFRKLGTLLTFAGHGTSEAIVHMLTDLSAPGKCADRNIKNATFHKALRDRVVPDSPTMDKQARKKNLAER